MPNPAGAENNVSRASSQLPDGGGRRVHGRAKGRRIFFTACGIIVKRVLTNNGSDHRSGALTAALGPVVNKQARPYRPPSSGKVERFNRTLEQEWAHARPYSFEAERVAAFPPSSTPRVTTVATRHSRTPR